MKKIAIQGHFYKSKDIIKILESLGGINIQGYIGHATSMYYYVNNKNHIECDTITNLPREYKKYTLKEYEQTFLNNMETKRNIQIDLTTAKEWYKQGGDLRKVALQAFTENELNAFPKSWEEYCKINPYLNKNIDFFIPADGTVTAISQKCLRSNLSFTTPSKERAEQLVVLNKLLQIRDYYNQGWEPNWQNDEENKYVIISIKGGLKMDTNWYINRLFAFKTRKLRDEFLQNFKSDLEFIKEFL